MDRLKLVPELNYWMGVVLHNSPLNETYFKVPSLVDDQMWRSPYSLLDLLFNETFIGRELGSSSSSNYDHFDAAIMMFSYGFRKADISRIDDNKITNRITIYAGNLDVYVANIPENEHLFAIVPGSSGGSNSGSGSGSTTEPDCSIICPTEDELFKAYDSVNKGIVPPTCTPYRSSLLIAERAALGEYYPPANLFDITDEDVGLLRKLYEYKTDVDVTVDDIDFTTLTSCLAKCVYIYLDWELNESVEHYDNTDPITDGSEVLCSLYEKHVLDHLYRVVTKRYHVTFTQDRVDEFIGLDHDYRRLILSETESTNRAIQLPSDEIPYDGRDIYLVHEGSMQEYGRDFSVRIVRPVIENQEIVEVSIVWNHNRYQPDDEIYYLWSFLSPESVAEFFENLNS